MNPVAQLDTLLVLMAVFGVGLGAAFAFYGAAMAALAFSSPRRGRRT